MNISYGEIFWIDFGKDVIGSEQAGVRPGIVVQNEKGNMYSPTINVVPLTTNIKKADNLPVHVLIKLSEYNTGLEQDSVALVEQIKTIDKKRIIKYIGECPKEVMKKIEIAMAIQLNIKYVPFPIIDITDLVESISNNIKISSKSKLGLTSEIKRYCDSKHIYYNDNVYNYAKELKQIICLV